MKRKKKTRTFEIITEIGVEHAGILLNHRFTRAIDAWNWASWNYKGRDGWQLRWIERMVPFEEYPRT